jgi:hypothetical protein
MQLPVEARGLFSIYASAALARYQSHPPIPSKISGELERVWNKNRLTCEELSDPNRMTLILEHHFAGLPSNTEGDHQEAQ